MKAANKAAIAVVTSSVAINRRRLSTTSASAPASSAGRNIGKVVATWTIDTISGSGARLVMSHPDAALYIQLPMFETTVAAQITANAA